MVQMSSHFTHNTSKIRELSDLLSLIQHIAWLLRGQETGRLRPNTTHHQANKMHEKTTAASASTTTTDLPTLHHIGLPRTSQPNQEKLGKIPILICSGRDCPPPAKSHLCFHKSNNAVSRNLSAGSLVRSNNQRTCSIHA